MKTQTVGDILSKERTRLGLTPEQLSQQTRIRLEHVLALEENQFSQLPAATFVKGYIKSYSRLLGFDHQPLFALLRRDYRESAKGTLVPREFIKPLVSRRKNSRLSFSMMVGAIFFFVVSTYTLIQWYQSQKAPEVEVYSPLDQALVGPTVTVVGQTHEDAIVRVNGQPVALQVDGSFSTDLFMEKEGITTILITATDEKEKETLVERSVYVQF